MRYLIATLLALMVLSPREVHAATDAEVQSAYDWAVTQIGFTKKPQLAPHAPQNLYDRDANIAMIMYDETGAPLFMPVPQVDEDDTVYVVVVGTDSITPVACGAAVDVRVAGGAKAWSPIPPVVPGAPPKPVAMKAFVSCASETGIKASFTNAGVTYSITIPTLSLNRLTVGLGIVFDFSQDNSFTTQTLKGSSVPTISEQQSLHGISPVALVSLRFEKVDTQRPRCTNTSALHCLARAVALTLGGSITDPVNHIYVGLTVEPWPGLGLTLGYHFHTEKLLANGYSVGDPFSGGTEVPTTTQWADPGKHFDGFLALNIDASLFAKILSLITK